MIYKEIPMIYTLTLNPAIDYEIELNTLKLGTINTTEEQHFISGGKGINVSRGLSYFGIDSIAVGFLGGFTGNFMRESLSNDKFESRFVTITDMTRINIKIHEINEHTDVTGKSPRISSYEIDQLLNFLDELKDGDVLILSGSQPRINFNLYKQILERYKYLNIDIVLDVPGDLYDELLSYQPILIKPNLAELSQFMKQEVHDVDDIMKASKMMIEKGSQSVFVSCGEKGGYFIDKNHIYHAKPVKGSPKRLFGAGDHFVAGYIYGHVSGLKIIDKLKYGIACASLQIFEQNGYNQTKVEDMFKFIEIEELCHD